MSSLAKVVLDPEQVVLDFETRSRVNLSLTGAIESAKHPSTSILCLAYKIDTAHTRLWIPERSPMPPDLWRAFQRADLVAHNASFERAIVRHCLPRYTSLTSEQQKFLEHIPASRWRCTAAKAAACSLPRNLEEVATILELPVKKDMEGNRLMKKYAKPRKPSKKDSALWWHDKDELRYIYRYCMQDVEAEYLLDQALPDLSQEEKMVWELDQKINDRGVRIDIPTVKIIIGMIAEETALITERVQKLSGGTIEGVTQTARVLEWVNRRGAQMPNLQAPTIRDKLLDTGIDDDVRAMLSYRKNGTKTSTAKYLAMVNAVGDDNRARELLLYCGAFVTGRWSGKRIQPTNFPRPTIKDFDSDKAIRIIQSEGIEGVRDYYGEDKVMEVLVSAIRGMLIASPGYELFCADFTSIELCLGFWLAGHDDGVLAINEGRKMYEEMAADAFGLDLKWLLTDEGKRSLERFVGKECVLACQYGMGWAKFLKNCHQKGVPQVTEEMAKKVVAAYRKKHYPIPDAWRALEQACIRVVQTNSREEVCRCTIYKSGKFLVIKLPSGRRLRYFKPRVVYKQIASGRMVPELRHWGYVLHQWRETSIWGGVIFNNIVQGCARDVMKEGMKNTEAAGYHTLILVHDENLAEKKKGTGNLKEFMRLMTAMPAWADGAPISCSGWVGPRYKK